MVSSSNDAAGGRGMKTLSCAIAAASLLSGTVPALAQSSLMSALQGHSIVARYSEAVMSRRHGSFSLDWSLSIYVSSKGRIFTKQDIRSSDPARDRHHLVAPEEGGVRGYTPFQWSEDGLTRSWVSAGGNPVRQSVIISQTPGGFECRVVIQRGRGRTSVLGQSCRVVRGNMVAGAS
jgi:hypothetical protein